MKHSAEEQRRALLAARGDTAGADLPDEHIAFTIAAARSHEKETGKRFPFRPGWDACCPLCKWGRALTEWDEKQERRLSWLVVLLRKRGRPDDERLARAIEMGAWP